MFILSLTAFGGYDDAIGRWFLYPIIKPKVDLVIAELETKLLGLILKQLAAKAAAAAAKAAA